MRGFKNVVSALVVFILILVLGTLLYIYVGAYNVAASEPHADSVTWLLKTAQVQSIRANADPLTEPLPTDSAAIWTGLEQYDAMCTTCHGAPGVEPSAIGEGLNPAPPRLDEEVVSFFSDAQLFWIVKHGIKMTGMPAYGETHSDEDIRAITAFMKQLPDLSAGEYREMQRAVSRSANDTTRTLQTDQARAGDDGHSHTH